MKPSGEIVDERGDAHRIEAGQETEANEIAERVGERQDFGDTNFGTGRWPSSEFPFCALSVAMDLYDGGVDHGVFAEVST